MLCFRTCPLSHWNQTDTARTATANSVLVSCRFRSRCSSSLPRLESVGDDDDDEESITLFSLSFYLQLLLESCSPFFRSIIHIVLFVSHSLFLGRQ